MRNCEPARPMLLAPPPLLDRSLEPKLLLRLNRKLESVVLLLPGLGGDLGPEFGRTRVSQSCMSSLSLSCCSGVVLVCR
jgi:hypothetical protein